MSSYAEKMQYRIVNKYAEYAGIRQKKSSRSAKQTWSIKNWQNIRKMQYRLCILPFLEVTILFNLHVIIVGNTVGKSPMGILTLLIESWNP